MRWFKHLSHMRDEELVAAYVAEQGLEGYGLLVAVLEEVARAMDAGPKCSLTLPAKTWANRLGVHTNTVLARFNALEGSGWVEVEFNCEPKRSGTGSPTRVTGGKGIRVTCRKLLSLRDEYSRKSGQAAEKVRRKDTESDPDPETDQDPEKHKHTTPPTGAHPVTTPRASDVAHSRTQSQGSDRPPGTAPPSSDRFNEVVEGLR